MKSDIRILEVEPYLSLEKAREPLKFGAVVVEEVLYVARARARRKPGGARWPKVGARSRSATFGPFPASSCPILSAKWPFAA